MNPSVSVIIPTYNRGVAIGLTIKSVLEQDLPPEEVEIIVVDDGSTNYTWKHLQAAFGDNPQIRLFTIPNGGVANARNFGLEKARGEFVAYLDHDDLWLPDKLRLQREKMLKNPSIGLVYCNWENVNPYGKLMPYAQQLTRHYWWRPKQGKAFPWILMPHLFEFLRNPISSMTFPLMRTQLVRDVGGFDVQMVPSDDWDLWIRLSKVTRFAYVPKVLARYVHHDGQQHKDLERAVSSWVKIMQKHPINPRRHPIVWLKQAHFYRFCHSLFLYRDAKEALFNSKYGTTIKLFMAAVFAQPTAIFQKRWIYLMMRVAKRNSEQY